MNRKITLVLVLLLVGVMGISHGQSKKKRSSKRSASSSIKPQNMVEAGIHGGYVFVAGDVTPEFGYGAGVSVRKAIDYMFSLRVDGLWAQAEGQSDGRFFKSNWYSFTGFGVISLNSFRFDKSVRKLNYYAMLGVGGNNFETKYCTSCRLEPAQLPEVRPYSMSIHTTGGAGIGFRINKRVNVALEHQASILFGRRSDYLDGIELEKGVRSPFRDILNYSNLKVNFNIGNSSRNSEPLYWINPLDMVLNDVNDLKKKTELAIEDTDNDGVIDAVDQEPNTPPNAPVDTKGRTLDSDKDGVADYKDLEPYYPPRQGEKVDANGVVMNPINRGGGVTEERVIELIEERLSNLDLSETGSSTVGEWFLPMIHFGTDSYTVKYSDYGTLAGIARMMKGNPNMRLVVSGFTDQTSTEEHNDQLSYSRAKSVIDHLVNNHGIGRGRLILEWKGESDALVPSTSSYMNRRVEFRAAVPSDVEMDPPSGYKSKKEGY